MENDADYAWIGEWTTDWDPESGENIESWLDQKKQKVEKSTSQAIMGQQASIGDTDQQDQKEKHHQQPDYER